MPVNIAYCSGENTIDGRSLIALNAVGSPTDLLIRLSVGSGASGHGRVMFKYYGESGCVCGVNDCGLFAAALSNYSKLPCPESGHTGRELAEIALCRCETPSEAIEKVVSLLGCGARTEQAGAQPAFLFASGSDFWLLETAGELWAAKKLSGFNALCGEYNIEDDYDMAHSFCARHPKSKGERLSFSKVFGDSGKGNSSGASLRRFVAVQELYNARNGAPVRSIKDMLVGSDRAQRQPAEGLSAVSIRHVLAAHGLQSRDAKENMCLHPDSCRDIMVNGSVVLSLEDGVGFFTPFGVPCRSFFVPFQRGNRLPFYSDEREAAAYALRWEAIRRRAECGAIPAELFESEVISMQEKLDLCHNMMSSGSDVSERAAEITIECLTKLSGASAVPFNELSARKLTYRKAFSRQNERLAALADELGIKI